VHILRLDTRVELAGGKLVVDPGEYVVEDMTGAQLLMLAGGAMGPVDSYLPRLNPADDYAGKNILIMRAGGFGDLTLMTPVLREIKRLWPTCRLRVATMPHYAPALAGLPYVDEILTYPLLRTIANENHVQIFLENAVERNPRAKVLHMTDLFAEIVGIPAPADMLPEYRVKASEAMWAAEAYPRNNGTRRVCLQLGASARCRITPPQVMGPVVTNLLKRNWQVFLLGDTPMQLKEGLPANLVNLTDSKLTFRQSCAVLAASDAVIGNDSALIHVAGALGVPAVGMYGAFPWELRTKYCPTTFAVKGAAMGPQCPCQYHANVPVTAHYPPDCPTRAQGVCGVLATIDPERVVAKVEQLARNPAGLAPIIEFPIPSL